MGTLDGDVVVWSDHAGAWVLTNGKWYAVDLWTVWNEAKINVPVAHLIAKLRDAPPLPTATPKVKHITAEPFDVVILPPAKPQ
jgi:hypothetical protein